jgi:hypothetical protein
MTCLKYAYEMPEKERPDPGPRIQLAEERAPNFYFGPHRLYRVSRAASLRFPDDLNHLEPF